MASSPDAFSKWLTAKLRELNTDEAVFGNYIIGILDGDETPEEKTDALEGILSEILTDNLSELIASILQKWQEYQAPQADVAQSKQAAALNVEDRLSKLLEESALNAATVKEREYTEEERKIREQILTQYSQSAVSEDEYDNDSDEQPEQKTAGTSSGLSGIEKNTNAQDVMQLQKERREQARMDSAAKKQKDKEDRAKQKQMREEKKEKRKTVKGERRR